MKLYLPLALSMLTISALQADNCNSNGSTVESPVRSLVLPRSQGSNTARELIGWQDYIHLWDDGCNYSCLTGEFEYTRTFKGGRIAKQLFGDNGVISSSGCGDNRENFTLSFQGSKVANRSSSSLIADNFGLSQNFDGSITFSPKIENFIFDINYYIGLDSYYPGLYFRTHMPITHTRWNLFDDGNLDCNGAGNAQSTTDTSANTPFPACYMADSPTAPADSIISALSGNFLFGNMQTPWDFGKFSPTRLDLTRLADIDLILGYDFIATECSHFGLYLQAVAPTGNRPHARFIFEPIVGNGHHWGLGGGVSAHRTVWESDCDQNLSLWFEGNVIHLFKSAQTRSFDFKTQGALSRYMLLKEFSDNVATENIINGINFATRRVESSFAVEGDASIKLAYRDCGFTADIGYNLWGRSKENINLCGTDTSLDNKYGIKGCQGVCYQTFTTATVAGVTTLTDGTVVNHFPLTNTSSSATMTSCGTVDNATAINPGANLVALTWDSTHKAGQEVAPTPDTGIILAQASSTPVLLTSADLNLNGVRSGLTNKLFGYIGYSWIDNEYTPFLGLHGEVEFAARHHDDTKCTSSCSSTDDTSRFGAVNQWGIGVKGGLAF